MFKSKGDQIDDVPYSDVPTNGGVDVSKFSVDDVCELIISLHLDPLPFKENAVEGADLLELTDVELAEYLGLKPLQIRKIRKRLAELSAQDPEEENEREIRSISIFRKYEEQMKSLPPQQEPQSGNQQESHPSSGFVSQSRFTDARGGEFDKPLNDMSNLKPCERGLVEGVYAGDGAEEAPRDETFEKEIFNLPNTGIDFDKFSAIPAEATGNNVPKPISTFAEANFHKLLAENVALAKYKNPTPVQRYGIAVAMAGRDMMACAQTGSGKTAAFLFPVISTLLTRGRTQADLVHQELGVRRRVYPDACILCPTRELALQIYDEARKFTYRSFVHAAVVYGGADPKGQLIQIKKGCHILIATPGRLNQMVDRGHISLSKIFFLILDEADRMLDMGFEPQIRQIVETYDLPKTGTRQTLMFSATFPREVQTLAGEFLQDYIFLTVGRVGSASTTITQDVQYVEENDKHDNLMRLLSTHNKGLTLVFVQTKKEADTLEEYVRRQGFPSTSLNGDRAQWEREDALESFRTGKTPVMIATDVAQRGLDIPNVNHVINFDMPANIDDYVHRIGRTGRVGNHGLATSFFNDQDTTLAGDLVVVLKEANQAVPDWLEACAMEATGGRTRYKFNSRDSRSERPRRDEGQRGGGFDNGSKSFDSESSFNSTPARSNGGGGDLWD